MALHSTLSCYVATAFAVAGVYAVGYLRGERTAYQRAALRLSMATGALFSILMPLSGDLNATYVSRHQPTKLAAMEAQFDTERGAPLRIGGWPDPHRRETRYAIEIPGALSYLAHRDPNAEVKGLDAFPRDQWPNVHIVHLAFQLMVGAGLAMVGVSLLYWGWVWRGKRRPGGEGEPPRWLAWGIAASAPLGFLALEAGWMVSEVGRQPWIIRDVMRTAEAVTPAAHVELTFWGFTLLYLFLSGVVAWYLLRLGSHGERAAVRDQFSIAN